MNPNCELRDNEPADPVVTPRRISLPVVDLPDSCVSYDGMMSWRNKLMRWPGWLRQPLDLVRKKSAPVCSSESGATALPADDTAPSSLAALLTRHILHDGEIVILLIKPSWWFIVLHSLRFIAATLIVMIAAQVYRQLLPPRTPFYITWTGMILISGRLMVGAMQWMARYYVLTDLRILRLQGVFAVDIFDCALRQVARVRRVTTTRERLLGLGTLEIIPLKEESPIGLWQTIARPRQVYQTIIQAINRAKQGGRIE